MDLIRFEDFDLDARSYRLRRSGQDLKLERIPLELLLLLVGHPGELVTREEIIEKLWGKGVQLDTENAINTAIRKVRLALGDDPAQPRFVQTVTGRGYRFIAMVAGPNPPAARERSDQTPVPGAVASASFSERDVPKASTRPPSLEPDRFSDSSSTRGNNRTADLPLTKRLRKPWRFAVLTAAAVCLSVVGIIAMRSK